MKPPCFFACILGAFALLAPITQARTPQEIATDLRNLSAAVDQAELNMMEALADNDRPRLATETQNAVAQNQALLAALNADETKAAFTAAQLAPLRLHVRTVLTDLTIADKILQNEARVQSQKIGAVRSVTVASRPVSVGTAKLDKSQPIVLLSEINALTAGFQFAQTKVCYLVQVLNDPSGTITEVTPEVVNPAEGLGYIAVQPTPSVPVVPIVRHKGTFCVTMGSNLGGAQVRVSVGGQPVAARLLFNKGIKPMITFDAMHVAHGPFDGFYSGGFGGTVKYRDPVTGDLVTMPVSGGVAFTVAARRIIVTAPASGQGTIALTGTSSLQSGGGSLGVPNATVTFHGALTIARSGAVSGAGSWAAFFKGGSGAGTWSASK